MKKARQGKTPLSVAQAILGVPADESSWDTILEEPKRFFIWTDDDVVEQWDQQAVAAGISPAEVHGESIEEPENDSVDVRLIPIHTLGLLVKDSLEIRFCVDSHISSDLAFLALPPADWKTLEKEFGTKEVAYRFLRLAKRLDAFEEQAYSDKNCRSYEAEAEPELSDEDEAINALLEEARNVAKALVPDVKIMVDVVFHSVRKNLAVTLTTDTDAQRDLISRDRSRARTMIEILSSGGEKLGLPLIAFGVQSQQTVDRRFDGFWVYDALESASPLIKSRREGAEYGSSDGVECDDKVAPFDPPFPVAPRPGRAVPVGARMMRLETQEGTCLEVGLSEALAPCVTPQDQISALYMSLDYSSGKPTLKQGAKVLTLVVSSVVAPARTRAEALVETAYAEKPFKAPLQRAWPVPATEPGVRRFRKLIHTFTDEVISVFTGPDGALVAVEHSPAFGHNTTYRRYGEHVEVWYRFPDRWAPRNVDKVVMKFLTDNLTISLRRS